MRKKKRTIPQFQSLDEEMDFWAKSSPLDFEHTTVTLADIRKEVGRGSKSTSVTLQLPAQDISRLKKAAAARGVSWETLAAELLRKELARVPA